MNLLCFCAPRLHDTTYNSCARSIWSSEAFIKRCLFSVIYWIWIQRADSVFIQEFLNSNRKRLVSIAALICRSQKLIHDRFRREELRGFQVLNLDAVSGNLQQDDDTFTQLSPPSSQVSNSLQELKICNIVPLQTQSSDLNAIELHFTCG